MKFNKELHDEAIAEGYLDETCSKCGTLFFAHIHFIVCNNDPCPMKSTKDTSSFLDSLLEDQLSNN